MRNKKLMTTILAVALVAAVGIGSTLAYFTDKGTKQNIFTMGKVDVDIDEPNFPKDPEDPDSGKVEDVRPNQTIAKDPRIEIKEDSLPAYVRAKIEIVGLTSEQSAELLKNININEIIKGELVTVNGKEVTLAGDSTVDNNKWVLNSETGYYYYQDQLKAGDVVYFFTKVQVPESWTNTVKEFKVNVTAEAIQADDFTPTTTTITNSDSVTTEVITGWTSKDGNEITPEKR